MSSGITLTAGVRQNLLSLQNTAALMATTQSRLATGKKVNSALDNPTSFFTSQSLSDRASDLNSLLDSIGQATQVLKAADTGITSLTSLVQSAKSIATQAQQSSKGTVNYTNITGSVALALDSTKVSSSASTVAAAGTASTQSTATLDVSALVTAAGAADGQTLSLSLNGVSKTYAFDHTSGNGTTTFSTLAELKTEVTADFQTTGAVATVGATAGTAFTVTGNDVSHDFTLGGTATTGTGTQVTGTSAVNHALGDALTVSDGTNTSTFYRVAANANAAAGTYSSSATLASAINSTANNIHTTITGAANGTGIDLTAAHNVGITVGGVIGSTLGFGVPAVTNNFNTTLNGLSGTVTVGVGSNTAHSLTFGSGNGQINTKAALDTALGTFTDITGSTDSTRHVNFAPTTSDNVTIGGSASVLSALGLSTGTTTPTATVVTPNTTRSNLQTQYNDLLTQIDQLAKDSSYNGINLLYGDNQKVTFNENGSSSLTVSGVKFDSTGLGLAAISGTGFQDDHNVNTTLATLDSSLTTLRTQAAKFGSNLTTVQTRQDFTKNLVSTLQTGADNLVLADTNEEGANMLALQTRQSLSTTALSLANQSSQAVLRLLGG
jgi:flagellin-like hook-associated protein FlgL